MITKQQNVEARKLVNALTPEQLDEVGLMLGMSNLGFDRFDKPEQYAESDEMFDGFMDEINVWRKSLRKKTEKWGWCNDLAAMCAEAVRRTEERANRFKQREAADVAWEKTHKLEQGGVS